MTTKEFIQEMHDFGFEVVQSGNDLLFQSPDFDMSVWGSVDIQKFNTFEVRGTPSRVVQVIVEYARTPFVQRDYI